MSAEVMKIAESIDSKVDDIIDSLHAIDIKASGTLITQANQATEIASLASIGTIGKYKNRCVFERLGSTYDFVAKIIMSDPIAWKLVNAYANIKKGGS